MLESKELAEKFPNLNAFSNPVKEPAREIIGREKEMKSIFSALQRPELSNVILIAEAGCGKTAIVQGISVLDKERSYLEIDLAKMISDIPDVNQMASRLKELFSEVILYHEFTGRQIVLFMDEFHQVVQLSPAAVEALKPLLADSGTRGICVICATTEKEFKQYIAPNQPLVERLQRININQPDEDMTVMILKGMARKYGVDHYFYNDNIYRKIYEYTNRYVPANSQPRKSILMLDAMVGWHRAYNYPLNTKLLEQVIYEAEGVNVGFKVDATKIKAYLDSKVYAQELASTAIESRLQICVAGVNNEDRPMSSFLFCGSTGVGKMLPDDTMIPFYNKCTGNQTFKQNGNLQVGDVIFDRVGYPTTVMGVFPKGMQDVYELEFIDGRKIECGDEHLWTYKTASGNGSLKYKVANTVYLMKLITNSSSRIKLVVPMNQAVHWCAATGSEENWYDMGRQCAVSETVNSIVMNRGSIEQRFSLIRGMFDVNGHLSSVYRRYELFYSSSSEKMVSDIQHILWSLGYSSQISLNLEAKRPYKLRVKCPTVDKSKFFTKTSMLELAEQALTYDVNYPKKRNTDFTVLGIKAITKLSKKKSMTCISVDNKEQLYQAGDFIVTHNTEMTKQLASILFNDDRNLLRFDMTEYANDESLERFRRELTSKVWFKPYSIILLDEIEKACAPVTRILLQVLDDGRLIDENNREVSFCNAYIVLTTNAGSEVFENLSQYNSSDTGDGAGIKHYMKLIRRSISETSSGNRFPPELLGRIDTIVPFQPLSENTMEKIVDSKLRKLCVRIKNLQGIRVAIDEKVIRFLVKDNLDTQSKSGGARIVVSKLEETVVTEIARYINSHPDVEYIKVVVKGELAIDNKDMRESTAYINVIGAVKR